MQPPIEKAPQDTEPLKIFYAAICVEKAFGIKNIAHIGTRVATYVALVS